MTRKKKPAEAGFLDVNGRCIYVDLRRAQASSPPPYISELRAPSLAGYRL